MTVEEFKAKHPDVARVCQRIEDKLLSGWVDQAPGGSYYWHPDLPEIEHLRMRIGDQEIRPLIVRIDWWNYRFI